MKNFNDILCICVYVYGTTYQGFIPMYVYSVIKNLPQYHVRVYLDLCLREDVRKLLETMNKEKYDIIENFKNPYFENDMEKRALRWMINDNALKNYKYVYIGDVDVYLVHDLDFLKVHILDMRKTKKNYSNAIRLTLKDFIKRGLKKQDQIYLLRLTGLHFYETNQYLKKINRAQQELLWIMENMSKISIYKRLFLKKYILTDDERVLWYLIFKSRMKMPKVSYQEYGNNKKCCRPMHGLHFGIGREKKIYEEQIMKDIKRKKINKILEWRKDFQSFKNDYNTDKTLRESIDFDLYVREIVFQTCDFFGYYIENGQIVKRKGEDDKWIRAMGEN